MNGLADWIDRVLADLAERDLLRSLKVVERVRGPFVTIGGREVLAFASNDYLGLSQDPRLAAAAVEAVRDFGWGAGASRLLTGTTDRHRRLEEALAKHTGRAVVTYASGSAANAGLVAAVADRGSVLACDALNHASLIDAARLSRARVAVYPHRDHAAAEEILARSREERRFILTDAVFSMDGDIAPLRELKGVAERHGADLLVDDAHGYGLLGPGGKGTCAMLDVEATVTTANLAKAAGSVGGFVAGTPALAKLLVSTSRALLFTTAHPAAVAAAGAAAVEALAGADAARAKVLALAARLRAGMAKLGLDARGSETPIVPVVLGTPAKALAAASRLWDRGLFVPAVRPPTVPEGQSRLRITVTALHEEEHVDRLLAELGGL